MSASLHSSHCALWTNRSVDVDHDTWRILIVDDNAYSAEALSAALESDGFDTRFALSGVDALHTIDGWIPHVVILDITMPEHDGYATARVLRRIGRTRDAVIIAFTALGEEIVRPEAVPSGFDGYCQKGNPPAELVRLIGRLVH
ncbi:response regulator receiver protein [Caballeronia temeraria]|uniref:Response regulator receiver protein n=1 Tax=Caballeronia temeraria TaxID=1777137 RepID=A0A158BSF4_9BURK|nr:response regulator [Caballeronia temeraria]SAK72187.1 response regulator receiver protein [Caballeronia temeraria]